MVNKKPWHPSWCGSLTSHVLCRELSHRRHLLNSAGISGRIFISGDKSVLSTKTRAFKHHSLLLLSPQRNNLRQLALSIQFQFPFLWNIPFSVSAKIDKAPLFGYAPKTSWISNQTQSEIKNYWEYPHCQWHRKLCRNWYNETLKSHIDRRTVVDYHNKLRASLWQHTDINFHGYRCAEILISCSNIFHWMLSLDHKLWLNITKWRKQW